MMLGGGRSSVKRLLHMDVNKILAELREERERIDEAIVSLERMALGRGKRRGRPPKWFKEAEERKGRGRPRKKAGEAR